MLRFAVAALVVLIVSPSAGAAPGPVLLQETFGERDAKGLPPGWRPPPYGRDAFTVEEEEGTRFLRMALEKPGTIGLYRTLELQPSWRKLRITLQARAAGLRVGEKRHEDARLALEFRDARNLRVGGWPRSPALKQDSGWAELSTVETITDAAAALSLGLGMWKSAGTFDVRLVRVEVVETGEPRRAPPPPDPAKALVPPLPAQRAAWTLGPVRVAGNTLVTADGKLLRAASMQLGRSPQRTEANGRLETWQAVKEHGLNAVRLSIYKIHPDGANAYGEWARFNQGEVPYPPLPDMRKLFEDIDRRLELSKQAGVYLILCMHFIGKHDRAELVTFWSAAAERYRDEPNMIFEICNEPVAWQSCDYTAADVAVQQELYGLIRAKAPARHIILLSFAATHAKKDPKRDMRAVADELKGVDWSNASVGFHPYANSPHGEEILRLKERYPVVATETQNKVFEIGKSPTPIDGEEWPAQTFERLRIAWMCFKVGDMPPEKNWEGGWREAIEALTKLGVYPFRD